MLVLQKNKGDNMSNLYSGTVSFKGYKTLAEVTDLTFTEDSKYLIQIIAIDGACYVREGTEGKGFLLKDSLPFQYIAGEDDLYVGNPLNSQLVINISGE